MGQIKNIKLHIVTDIKKYEISVPYEFILSRVCGRSEVVPYLNMRFEVDTDLSSCWLLLSIIHGAMSETISLPRTEISNLQNMKWTLLTSNSKSSVRTDDENTKVQAVEEVTDGFDKCVEVICARIRRLYGPSYDGVIFATLPAHGKNFCGCIRNDPSLADIPGAGEASNLGRSEAVRVSEQRDGGMVIPLKRCTITDTFAKVVGRNKLTVGRNCSGVCWEEEEVEVEVTIFSTT